MAFDIKFLPPVLEGSQLGNAALTGRIILGEYEEDFVSLIGFWSPRDYECQWRTAIERMVRMGCDSCLITSIHDPTESDIGRWWLLYPDRGIVHVQEALLLFNQLSGQLSVDDPYGAILPRRTYNEEGMPISEWDLPLQDFVEFLRHR